MRVLSNTGSEGRGRRRMGGESDCRNTGGETERGVEV